MCTYPSVNDVLKGLTTWYTYQVLSKMLPDKSENEIMRSKKDNIEFFYALFETVKIKEWDTRMSHNQKRTEANQDLDLANPYSKFTCLITQLYSMELG